MLQEIPALDTAGLRRFGLIFAAIISVLFGILFPLVFGTGILMWPWVVGGIFVAWSLLAPASLNGFYRLWMRFGFVMGAIMNRVILGIVYYLIVLPTGMILRCLGKDPMRRQIDPNVETYRIESNASDPERMDKPF